MDLLEYQAKELFQEVGIPILPSQPINNPSELKRLHIPYPVVLKSQVRAKGRGKAGGIRFVKNTIDAIAAAHMIFNLPIMGEYPEVLLAEARYNAKEEFFLAILLDYQLQCPILLGSVKGGMEVENLLKHLEKVVIDDTFSSFYARRLATKMGLKGALLRSVSLIIEKMYTLFHSKDLDLIEINPLGISATGEVMALDGKIAVNDQALARQTELMSLITRKGKQPFAPTPSPSLTSLHWLDKTKPIGNIALICNSFGLALSTWDSIVQKKGKPACCLVLAEDYSESSLLQQLKQGLEQLKANSDIKVILVNLMGNSQSIQTIIAGIADDFSSSTISSHPQGEERKNRLTHQPQLVMRIVGIDNLADLIEHLATLSVYWLESLEESINQTIKLAKG